MINIVIPMAGRGSRFEGTAERVPKPLIEVQPGRRMIEYVVDYLRLAEPHRFIFVCQAEHARRHRLADLFATLAPGHELVLSDAVTRGPAATALLAAPLLGPDDELLVAYCDCFFTIDISAFLGRLRGASADGGVLIFPSTQPSDAYALVDPQGRISQIVEKEVISGDAVAGLFYFRRGEAFVGAAEAAIASTPADREAFVSNVCDRLIADGGTVLGQRIDRRQWIEMGTPADLALSRQWLATHRPTAMPGRRG
ncbi:NTP transferase domain-containing protein [Devosia sp. LjRoot16]|uniref:sugar phosphate nucleotidyltransferase n=1 Tax=Devosia sp. LjRoot16 TaxID=3342271 RepID=UPI003ECC4984